jgi:CheY-like chemotaxis protein
VDRLDYVLRTAPAKLPRLILIDIHMTYPNGQCFLDAHAQLPAALRQHVAVYVLSDSLETVDQLQAARYEHVRGFMAKPLSAEDLQAIQG